MAAVVRASALKTSHFATHSVTEFESAELYFAAAAAAVVVAVVVAAVVVAATATDVVAAVAAVAALVAVNYLNNPATVEEQPPSRWQVVEVPA